MRGSTDRIITTHVGSLPRPDDLLTLARTEPYDREGHQARLEIAVGEIVARQIEHGIDVIDDGEFGKSDFAGYANSRFGGFTLGEGLKMSFDLRDHHHFPEHYAATRRADPGAMATILRKMYPPLVCTGPITYTGHALLARDIANLKKAAKGRDVELFMPAISPENAQYGKANDFYATEQEFALAIADALREEYEAIVAAGLLVQIDDPQFVTYFNRNPDKSVAECRRWAESRIEILNHALRNIPEDRIRFHTCYSFDVAPRTGDMELKDILDIILKVKAGGYSFEGANPRHEHEWELWREAKLPDGKRLIPGCVAISTIVVEHPDLVAQRIVRYAGLVGRENVIASADCGFGTVADALEMHPSIAWAKLGALVEGARRASKQLWR